MKRLIVYDLDGTLVDTLQDITNAANHMLSRMQAQPLSPDQVRVFVGRGMSQLIKDCLKTDDPERLTEGMRIYRAYYHEHLMDHSRLYPGALEVLEYFQARTQAVISNKPNPYSTDLLKALGIAKYFLEIIGGDAPYPRKPDPSSLRVLMGRSGATANETMIIGDSPIDIETGRRAGVLTASLAHGLTRRDELAAAKPDAMVDNFESLLALAKEQGW